MALTLLTGVSTNDPRAILHAISGMDSDGAADQAEEINGPS
jgi:hypothetical protein